MANTIDCFKCGKTDLDKAVLVIDTGRNHISPKFANAPISYCKECFKKEFTI